MTRGPSRRAPTGRRRHADKYANRIRKTRDHYRADGRPKQAHSEGRARAVAKARSAASGLVIVAYPCLHCPAWHIGRRWDAS